jgi:putative nucleotidyltransferase with HDIG domain
VFLLPFGIAPFLVTLLAGSATGFAVGLWTSVGMALMSRRDLLILLMGFLNAGFIAFAARAVKTRSKALRVGALAGLVCAPAVLASWGPAWEHADVLAILFRVGACVLSGIISALAGLLLLPLFERLFGLTSNITLFDFSDLGHPLLQRLALEAPGTYHHSLIVANLAQAAADEVGANPVLARVGAYFHDVGKLAKPRFFSENVPMQKNPHDDLSPSMSALLVTSHVKEGLSLALLYRLPKPVVDVIREHHGTGLVSYFHFKAKAAAATELEFRSHLPAEASPRVDESAFRYAGPKPRSRESGIIGLADAVEAASRSLAKVTPRHIESLVDEIVTARIEDGQLDHCPLTLADVRKISKSFVFTLSNVLHARVPYPRNENRD